MLPVTETYLRALRSAFIEELAIRGIEPENAEIDRLVQEMDKRGHVRASFDAIVKDLPHPA